MRFYRVGQHHVFQHAAFLANFQFAVAIGPFEVVVHVEQQLANVSVFETEFFRQHQRAAGIQPLINLIQQCLALRWLKELQGKIQHHHRGVFDSNVANIAFDNLNRGRCLIGINMTTAALNHRRGVIDGNNFAILVMNIATHRERRRAQRTAQIVDLRVGLYETFGQHANHRYDIGIARNGTLDHIREDFSYPFIKGPVTQTGDRRRKKRVAVRHNVKIREK
ncbi:Uncharacterised protein [Enterobacter cloacae]|nr:Uncharacterised protein [Enterobacter cloacae]